MNALQTRPRTKYSPVVVDQLLRVLRGCGDSSAACSVAGIAEKTYKTWMKKYPDFQEEVERALTYFREVACKSETDLVREVFVSLVERLRGKAVEKTITIDTKIEIDIITGEEKVVGKTHRQVIRMIQPSERLLVEFLPQVLGVLNTPVADPSGQTSKGQDNTSAQQKFTLDTIFRTLKSEVETTHFNLDES